MSVVPIAVFYLSVGYGMKKMCSANTIRNLGILGLCLLVIGLGIMIVTKSNLVLKLNDILPFWKVAFSTMEAMGILLILSTIAPPFCKSYIALYTYWNILERTQWLSLRSTCQYSFIVKLL